MVMNHPEADYDFDSDVPINVTAYKRGQLFTPTDIKLVVGATDREVRLFEKDLGRYEGGFTIMASDLDSQGVIEMYVTVWDGTKTVRDLTHLYTVLYEAFELDLILADPEDAYPRPGEVVEMQVRSLYMGQLVNPEDGSLYLSTDDGIGLTHNLGLEKVGHGMFNATYVVPDVYVVSTTITFNYGAEYNDGLIPAHTEFWEELLFVDFLTVWVDLRHVSTGNLTMEVATLDLDGNAVGGVPVSVEYSYFVVDKAWPVTRTVVGTTDHRGKVVLELAYEKLRRTTSIFVLKGNATYGSNIQLFSRQAIIPWGDEDPDPNSEFRMRVLFEVPVPLDELVTLRYMCWFDGEPLADHDVYAYLYDVHTGYYCGAKSTDAEGILELTVLTPKSLAGDLPIDGMLAQFQIEHDGKIFVVSSYVGVSSPAIIDYYGGPSDLELDVHPFTSGSEVCATMRCDDADGVEETAWVLWGLWDLALWDKMFDPGWEVWNPKHHTHFQLVPCTWVDGVYRAVFQFPDHLPDDSRMFVIGVLRFYDPSGDDLRAAVVEGLFPVIEGELPTIKIEHPAEAGVVHGIVNVTGTAWEGVSVDRVMVRIDWGDWQQAEGTSRWTFQLDAGALSEGEHLLEVRSFSGEWYHRSAMVNFTVAGPPQVAFTSIPTDGSWYGMVEVTGVASGDLGVLGVDVRVDWGEWQRAQGTTTWTFSLNTSLLSRGNHTIEAMSHDIVASSYVTRLGFAVDQPPTVTILFPRSGDRLSGTFEVSGTATDDGEVMAVEYRVVGKGAFRSAVGTGNWTHLLDTSTYIHGSYVLMARAYDGMRFANDSVSFFVDQVPNVRVSFPANGSRFGGWVVLKGGVFDEGGTVRLDILAGEWPLAVIDENLSDWEYILDTHALPHGWNVITFRAWDEHQSVDEELWLFVDQVPTARFVTPLEGDLYSGTLSVTGSAIDDGGVVEVEVRLDGGDWFRATGLEEWHTYFVAKELSSGHHFLEARAFDGEEYSTLARVEFDYEGDDLETSSSGLTTTIALLVLILAIVGGVVFYNVRSRRLSEDHVRFFKGR